MLVGQHGANLDHIMLRIVGLPRSLTRDFEQEAYGASLALIYFRALPLSVRLDYGYRLQLAMNKGVGDIPNKPHSPRGTSNPKLVAARKVYFGKLNTLWQSAFAPSSFNALSDPNDPHPFSADNLIRNCWSLSDTEFAQALVLFQNGLRPNLKSSDEYKDAEKSKVASAATSMLKDEFIDFISDFVSESASKLRPFLMAGVRGASRASGISALLEALIDAFANSEREARYGEFKFDLPRRRFLASNGWGDFKDPETVRPVELPAYARPAVNGR